jgi:dTDP-glucose 4,6-dehydratase
MPIFILQTGAFGHTHLLELACRNQAKILFASSSEVYGDPLVHPQREDYAGNVNVVGPRGCYDEAKRFAEAMSIAYHRERHVDIRIARIFNTYGPRMRRSDGRLIPNLMTQALAGEPLTIFGDGQQTRSFCYISDMVKGLIALMRDGNAEPTNLGNPVELDILSVAQKINDLTGGRSSLAFLPLPEDDPYQRRPDIQRALETLNWRPQVSLETGLLKTLEYFRNLPAVDRSEALL